MKFVLLLVLSVCLLSCQAQTFYTYVSPAVRLVNGIPNGPLLDVYFNNHLVFSASGFGSASPYQKIDAGTYDIRLVSRDNGKPLYTIKDVTFSNQIPHYTIVAQGSLDIDFADDYPFGLAVFVDENDARNGVARVRFYHCSVNSDNVNVVFDTDSIFGNVGYAELSEYKSLPEGTYSLSVVSSASGEVLVDEELDLEEQTLVSIYFVGESDEFVDTDRPNLLVVKDSEYVPYFYYVSENPASVLHVSFMVLLGLLAIAMF